MDKSKPYQTELSYSNGAGVFNINLHNKKITYVSSPITIGCNQNEINVSFVYNYLFNLANNKKLILESIGN